MEGSGNQTMYLIREFEVRLISQTGLAVQSMQVSVYISYFENIMNAGCSGWCTELRICQDITRLESAEANWRTGDPERRLLATFSWRQTRPAAQC